MLRSCITCVFLVALLFAGCSSEERPPIQGPAVQGNGVVIDGWSYLGPDAVKEYPAKAPNVRVFGTSEYPAWVIWTETGFDLVWLQLRGAVEPVVVVHEGAIDFWPGESLDPNPSLIGLYHKLTVVMKTSIPPDQWRLTLHPPAS